MIKICIFDLDETLLRTEDMKDIREAGKNDASPKYMAKVQAAFHSSPSRQIYDISLLNSLRQKFPKQKLCIFTRSPRSYATTVLSLAYPGFQWDLVVSYEDVKQTKPYGEGIDKCMSAFGVKYLNEVALVGDGDIDVRAAYHAGCVVVVDKTAWPKKLVNEHWNALGHISDAVISAPDQLIEVLTDYEQFLPDLERRLASDDPPTQPIRFDKINKFIPRYIGGDGTAFPIHTAGRSFSGYDSLKMRRQWHLLTTSIHENKDSETFPDEWISSIRLFIRTHFSMMSMWGGEVIVSVIPHRPGRAARLEMLLAQLEQSYADEPAKGKLKLRFVPKLLSYKVGVLSNSNDKLPPKERFENVRNHLMVHEKAIVAKGGHFLIIDDVSTTGSTLIYATKYLKDAGATAITCFSIAMNVSNVLYD